MGHAERPPVSEKYQGARKQWVGLLGFGLGCWLALASLDRLCQRIYDPQEYVMDPDFGEVRQNHTAVFGLEGWGTSHWGERGIRTNANPTLSDPQQRILVVGDSYTEALQVDDGETFCSLAEAELRQQGWPVELLNAGHTDRSVADYVFLAPAFQKVFTPDWTVIVVDDYDWVGDSWNPAKRHFGFRRGRLRVEDAAGSGGESSPSWTPPALPAMLPTHVERLFRRRRAEFEQRWNAGPQLFLGADGSEASPPPTYPVARELECLAQAWKGRISLVYVRPFQPEGRSDASPVFETIANECRRMRVPLVNLKEWHAPLIQAGVAPQGFWNSRYNRGHANQAGHAMMARALARHLRSLRREMGHGVL